MGCGKSTVGRKLATKLNLQYLDTDLEIERLVGQTIAQIFAKYGAIRFRSEETLLLKRLAGRQDTVIATGGGIVLNPENRKLLQADGIIIHLYASPQVIYQRVKDNHKRPLLATGTSQNSVDLKQHIHKLLNKRTGVYDIAELAIDTGKYNADEVVEMIISYLKERKDI